MSRRSAQLIGTAFTAGSLFLAPSAIALAETGGPCETPGCPTNGVDALLVGGQGSYAVLTPEQMSTAFGGYFANYDSRTSVPFPGDADFNVSIPEGATNLVNAVYAEPAGAVMTIGGVSKGAPSVIYALKQLEADRENTADGLEPPDAQHLNVLIYGAPSRIYYTPVKYRPNLPVTPYDVVMVSAEYDGIADMPDNMFNILAVLNAAEGADMLHVDAAFNTDFVNDPMHYKVETNKDGGTVTTVVIPYTDAILPLLHPALEAGGDPVKLAKLSAALKPIIDSAYKRNNVIEKKKWTDGIVNIPLPAAAPTMSGDTPSTTRASDPGTENTAVTTLSAKKPKAAAASEEPTEKPAKQKPGKHRLNKKTVKEASSDKADKTDKTTTARDTDNKPKTTAHDTGSGAAA
jgi:hypothetical protein